MLVPGVPYIGPPAGYTHVEYPKFYIAWHNTSNTAPAKIEAQYATHRTDSVSSHFYADAGAIYQSLDTKWSAWHAGSAQGNQHAVALEMVGTNNDNTAHWRAIIDRVAPAMAEVCKFHGIPVRFLGVSQAKAGMHGFVTHDVMRQAWGGTTHNDPGPNFPQDYAVQAINAFLNPVQPSTMEDDDMHVMLAPGQTEFFSFNGGTLAFATDFTAVGAHLRVALWDGTGKLTIHEGQSVSVGSGLRFALSGAGHGSVSLDKAAENRVSMDVLR